MKALIFSPESLYKLNHYTFTGDWFSSFALPKEEQFIKRVQFGEFVYFLDRNLDTDEGPFIVICVSSDDNVLREGLPQAQIVDRMITITKSFMSTSVSIPVTWRPRHEGNTTSVYCANRTVGSGERLHVERNPKESNNIYFFSVTENTVVFDSLPRSYVIYEKAMAKIEDAILSPFQDSLPKSQAGIVLTQRLPQGFTQGASLSAWYETKLTKEQRAFVDRPHDGPIRLRGSAGTGKTLSLVVKFLRDALASDKKQNRKKLGFITHSNASSDLVRSIVESLDPKGVLYGASDHATLEIRTIYDVAYENLRVNLDDLEPLSLDGRTGRELQLELIASVLSGMANSEVVKARFDQISDNLKDGLNFVAMGEGSDLIRKISNEFASVLDAEGIRAGEEKGEKYAKAAVNRPAWLMSLKSEIDRRFVLEIHKRYRKTLAEMDTLSIDQMIGDFNQFLESNRWDQLRSRQGYDALYIDELHLFTSTEREVLHKMIREQFDDEDRPRRPAIFMAYDLKQSPRDSFTHYGDDAGSIFTPKNALQGSELFQLTKIFRYTPQIADFLTDLDSTFPAIDIPGEWNAYSGEADLDDGPVPLLHVFKDKASLFKDIFGRAAKEGKARGGRRVAVLCASDEDFSTFLTAAEGQFRNKFIAIEDREIGDELRHAGNRFIFSTPEYVAGLQFECVFLISVNQAEAPTDCDLGQRRQFISNIYLGASRAEIDLVLAAAISDGGPSDILNFAIDRGSLANSTS